MDDEFGKLALLLLPIFFGSTVFFIHRWMVRMEKKVDVLLDAKTGVFVQLALLRGAIAAMPDDYEGPRRRRGDGINAETQR